MEDDVITDLMSMMFRVYSLLKSGEVERAILLLENGTEGIKRITH